MIFRQILLSSTLHKLITHTHNTQPFYGSVEFVRENPGEPVPEETLIIVLKSYTLTAQYMLYVHSSEAAAY